MFDCRDSCCPIPSTAVARFVGASDNSLVVDVPKFPKTIEVPGSRNAGFVTGDGLKLVSCGVKVLTAGVYNVSFNVVLAGGPDEDRRADISALCVTNKKFKSQKQMNLAASTQTLAPAQRFTTQYGAQSIFVLKAGDVVSLLLTNEEFASWVSEVHEWTITLSKICG